MEKTAMDKTTALRATDKPWHEMTADERLAARIAKNREIDRRVAETKATAPVKSRSSVASRGRVPAAATIFDKFQEIKRTQGIDAASEYLQQQKS